MPMERLALVSRRQDGHRDTYPALPVLGHLCGVEGAALLIGTVLNVLDTLSATARTRCVTNAACKLTVAAWRSALASGW